MSKFDFTKENKSSKKAKRELDLYFKESKKLRRALRKEERLSGRYY